LFIESLGDDLHTLRACSLVSSVFRHFCSPVLYRDIVLDRIKKVDTFIQIGERSISLQHAKSLSLTYFDLGAQAHIRKPRKILDIVSRKASLEALRLHTAQFHAEPLTASLLSKLSTVTALVLQECRFGGFEDFTSFIRCFPRCETLCLHGCTWLQGEHAKPRFRGLPVHDLAPSYLAITSTTRTEWGEDLCDQGELVGMDWLDLTGLKSFRYVIEVHTRSRPVLERIAACELLEEIDVAISHTADLSFGERKNVYYDHSIFNNPDFVNRLRSVTTQLTPFIARIKSLTLRCLVGLLPWCPMPQGTPFPPSPTLEHIRILTPGPPFGYGDLDATFSDTNRYPSLEELELCSILVAQVGKKGRDTHTRLRMDNYLPRLKAMGRLST